MTVITEESVFFTSDNLTLHGGLSYNEDISSGPAAVLCPPHPQLGGDMDNNIITAIHKGLASKNIISLRFNYRGVGKSEGCGDEQLDIESLKTFWEESYSPFDLPRQHDAAAALNYLKGVPGVDRENIFLIGYSFGAYSVQQIALADPYVRALILIAPTIRFHDFSPLNNLSLPKLIIWSDNDFSCPSHEYEKSFMVFAQPKKNKIFRNADHFFIGKEEALSDFVTRFVVNLYTTRNSDG
jgi:alpha/beta superfamily hydrolase